ncbi:lactonase family protein [Sporolactobacillus kofuensis]|nr:lactonase family protein [Sporolactobacillus kofuensis]
MSQYRAYIGTYTKGKSEGIYSFVLDTARKQLTALEAVAQLGNPTYLAVSEDNHYLHAVEKKGALGGVVSFAIGESGKLVRLNEQLAEGASPCYVSVNRSNGCVLTANYHKGTADNYPVTNENGVQAVAGVVQHKGSGTDPDRQEGPHVHYADFTPDERFAVTVDLGIDELTTYSLSKGKWIVQHTLNLKPGTGPRHLAYHPFASFAYVMSELSSEVIALQFDAKSGSFSVIQTLSALPADYSGHNQGSAIKVSADGRFVYVSNRGHNSLAVFHVDSRSGKLTLVHHVGTKGDWPRDFELDPSGKFLVVANQNSGDLVLFERDAESGLLSMLDSKLNVPDPVCIKFLHV